MVDREKVIDGLQEAAAYFRSSFDAMYGTFACEKFRSWVDAIEHALALLKEQEPVKPVPDTSYGARPWWFVCGNCKLSVNEDQKYCPNCGRAVKW